MSQTKQNKASVSVRYYSTIEMVLMGIGLGIASVLYVAMLLHLIELVLPVQ